MNVGIVVHSQTGHTEFLAGKIKDILKENGHKTDCLKLEVPYNESRTNSGIKFVDIPDISSYDIIVFGSHVEAFNLAKVMQNYLRDVDSIEGKKVICLLTQGLPYKWMGVKQSLKQMRTILEQKGAEVIYCDSVSWANVQKREQSMTAIAEEIMRLLL